LETEKTQQLIQNIQNVGEIAREQQFSISQQIQSNLNQSSTFITDSKRLENLYNLASQLQQAAMQGISELKANANNYRQIIETMEKECFEELISQDMQVIQAMQQAISALAQAQNALLQSNSISKMFDFISKCENTFTQIENGNTDLNQ